MTKAINYTNRRHGLLVAKYSIGMGKHRQAIWRFDCDCGGFREVPANQVFRKRNGKEGGLCDCGCVSRGKPQKTKFDSVAGKVVKRVLQKGVLARRVYVDGKLKIMEVNAE